MTAATRTEISGWFDLGVDQNKAYMIVWCDDYDYEDYAVYYDTRGAAQKALDEPSSMQRAMECYDLTQGRDEQLDQPRCWALRRIS